MCVCVCEGLSVCCVCACHVCVWRKERKETQYKSNIRRNRGSKRVKRGRGEVEGRKREGEKEREGG